MSNGRLFIAVFALTFFLISCLRSKKALDNAIINYGIKKQVIIRELSAYAVLYTIDNPKKMFLTDTLSDKIIKRKFNSNGYGGLVTVTFEAAENNKISGVIDSTVIFKQMTFRGVTEIIYDFATSERRFGDENNNPNEYVFRKVASRIYYRRRPVPMM